MLPTAAPVVANVLYIVVFVIQCSPNAAPAEAGKLHTLVFKPMFAESGPADAGNLHTPYV